jgi:hypothetical protein
MNRLTSELHRLYCDLNEPASTGGTQQLIDSQQGTRALVLELGQPGAWAALARLGNAVQAELRLPAPAIAVNGRDAYQLWFSLAESAPLAQASAFLIGLKARYLADLLPGRVRFWPDDGDASQQVLMAPNLVPAHLAETDVWSAFVAPDLAPMFEATPWLDVPPSQDGQAELLARLDSVKSADFMRALAELTPKANQGTQASSDLSAGSRADPMQFLQAVMADELAPLALRVEAAKALLPYMHKP